MATLTPPHRIVPDLQSIIDDKYIFQIQAMRNQIRGVVDYQTGEQIGPITHAMRNLRGFNESASEWGEDHIIRFQCVINDERSMGKIFPKQYIPRMDDPTMMKLRKDEFFAPTEDDVRRGFWKSDTYHNAFFIDLLHLLVNASPPILPIPSTRAPQPREAKTAAKVSIRKLIDGDNNFLRPGSPTLPGSVSPMSVFSAGDSHATNSLIHWGPRETSTHSMYHNMLKAIACVEFDNGGAKDYFWLPAVDSEKVPVVAAGNVFLCETDGAVHVWKNGTFGCTRACGVPICLVECKRGSHSKKTEAIIAQEMAELLGMALLNYATHKPSLKVPDEVYLLCCHHTEFHISSAVISPEYIEALYSDTVPCDQFIVLKRSQTYDLAKPVTRMNATMQIIGLLRYLRDVSSLE